MTFIHAAPPQPAPTPSPSSSYHPSSYFFTIDLDPRYQIVGKGALTEEDAATANCYCFRYNSNGKLQEIEYRRAHFPMPDPLLGVTRIDFEYQPGIERRWYRDETGQPAKDIGGIQGEELTLNPAGFPTDITNLDASGGRAHDSSGVTHYVRTLDSHDRVVIGRRIGLFGTAITDDNGYFETRTAYDEAGRQMERGNYDSSGNLLNNNDGVAIVRTSYTIFPDSTQVIESYFDSSSLAVEEKSSGVHQRQRTFDRRGLLMNESYFDATGAPCSDLVGGVHEKRYTYDERGNQLSESYFDDNGKPVNQKTFGFAKVVYKYNDKNRISEKAYFGDDGTPQILLTLGAAVIKQEYDHQGNVIRRQFLDGQGQPSSHVRYGVPSIRIHVEGDTTYVSLRDKKDKPAKNPINGYYSFSYKTATDQPLSLTNDYYDQHGHHMSFLRVRIINPHLYALKTTPSMEWSARLGVSAAGLGALLGCLLALRKASHTKRRKVYIPRPVERFLGWLAVFCILEGSLRFLMTIYWAWVGYQNGRMGPAVYILETIFIIFFLYRLLRLNVTMRVLNIRREDIHGLIRDFFAKANLKAEWNEAKETYATPPFGVRVRFFEGKYHAYLSFLRQQIYSPVAAVVCVAVILWIAFFGQTGLIFVISGAILLGALYIRLTRGDRARYHEGHELARGLARYLRKHVRDIQSPVRTRAIALYYPSVALCYFLLAGTAFYTLWQMLKEY